MIDGWMDGWMDRDVCLSSSVFCLLSISLSLSLSLCLCLSLIGVVCTSVHHREREGEKREGIDRQTQHNTTQPKYYHQQSRYLQCTTFSRSIECRPLVSPLIERDREG